MAIFIRLLGLMCRGAQHWTDFVVRNAVRNYQEGTVEPHGHSQVRASLGQRVLP